MKHAFRWTLGLLAVLILINSSLRTAAAQIGTGTVVTTVKTFDLVEDNLSLTLAPGKWGIHSSPCPTSVRRAPATS